MDWSVRGGREECDSEGRQWTGPSEGGGRSVIAREDSGLVRGGRGRREGGVYV